MSFKLGFIGCGNMASAIINGAVSSQFLNGGDICVFDVDSAKCKALSEKLSVNICTSAEETVKNSDVTVLAVKPQVFPAVLPQIKEELTKSGSALVSIGAGKTLRYIGSFLNSGTPVVRVMPNINAKVGEAMSAVCGNESADESLLEFVKGLCGSFGEVVTLPEEQFPLFGVIAGCSPAFSFMYIDALARAAVKNGMNKQTALKISAQAVLGSAKTVLEDNSHPWELIDSVCSPGGTTIEGVASLEKDCFDAAVMNAVEASLDKDKKL